MPPRGLTYGNVSSLQFYTAPNQISWAYNYYSLPVNFVFDMSGPFPPPNNPFWTFYPLLFNDDPSLTSVWEANVNSVISNLGTDTLFSFNEPDLCVAGSACTSVEQALVAYERFIQPFAECGIRLAAPSVSNAPGGLSWLTEFLDKAAQRNLTVDIINLHWYASPYSIDYFMAYMKDAEQRFPGRTIWLTEYGMDALYSNESAVIDFMKRSTIFLNLQAQFEKYAWFGNFPSNLLNTDGSALSDLGLVWQSFSGERYLWFDRREVENDGPVERPAGLATPEELAAFKNQQLRQDLGDEWLRQVRGESG